MTATFGTSGNPKKEKVTVSVDAGLLSVVDSFVEKSKISGISRSSVFEYGLHLWKQEMRDQFDSKYYAENSEVLDKETQLWADVNAEAIKAVWKK